MGNVTFTCYGKIMVDGRWTGVSNGHIPIVLVYSGEASMQMCALPDTPVGPGLSSVPLIGGSTSTLDDGSYRMSCSVPEEALESSLQLVAQPNTSWQMFFPVYQRYPYSLPAVAILPKVRQGYSYEISGFCPNGRYHPEHQTIKPWDWVSIAHNEVDLNGDGQFHPEIEGVIVARNIGKAYGLLPVLSENQYGTIPSAIAPPRENPRDPPSGWLVRFVFRMDAPYVDRWPMLIGVCPGVGSLPLDFGLSEGFTPEPEVQYEAWIPVRGGAYSKYDFFRIFVPAPGVVPYLASEVHAYPTVPAHSQRYTGMTEIELDDDVVLCPRIGDVNGDGRINIIDLTYAAYRLHTFPVSDDWDSFCDLNRSGTVSITDLVLVAQQLGQRSEIYLDDRTTHRSWRLEADVGGPTGLVYVPMSPFEPKVPWGPTVAKPVVPEDRPGTTPAVVSLTGALDEEIFSRPWDSQPPDAIGDVLTLPLGPRGAQ